MVRCKYESADAPASTRTRKKIYYLNNKNSTYIERACSDRLCNAANLDKAAPVPRRQIVVLEIDEALEREPALEGAPPFAIGPRRAHDVGHRNDAIHLVLDVCKRTRVFDGSGLGCTGDRPLVLVVAKAHKVVAQGGAGDAVGCA